MKTIATFEKPEEAHLLRMRLEAFGIPAYLEDENITQLGTWKSNAIGGVRLQVADEEAEAALQFIAEESKIASEDAVRKETEAIECCACRAPIPVGQTRCAACGWSYEDKAEEPSEEKD